MYKAYDGYSIIDYFDPPIVQSSTKVPKATDSSTASGTELSKVVNMAALTQNMLIAAGQPKASSTPTYHFCSGISHCTRPG